MTEAQFKKQLKRYLQKYPQLHCADDELWCRACGKAVEVTTVVTETGTVYLFDDSTGPSDKTYRDNTEFRCGCETITYEEPPGFEWF